MHNPPGKQTSAKILPPKKTKQTPSNAVPVQGTRVRGYPGTFTAVPVIVKQCALEPPGAIPGLSEIPLPGYPGYVPRFCNSWGVSSHRGGVPGYVRLTETSTPGQHSWRLMGHCNGA
eukprot:1630739-Rhodomonas_salina.1